MKKDYTWILDKFNNNDITNEDFLEFYQSEAISSMSDIAMLIKRIDNSVKEKDVSFKYFYEYLKEVFTFFLIEDLLGRKQHNTKFLIRDVRTTVSEEVLLYECLFSEEKILDECLMFFNFNSAKLHSVLVAENSMWTNLVKFKVGSFNEKSSKNISYSDYLAYILKNKNLHWFENGSYISAYDLNECLDVKNYVDLEKTLEKVG